MNHCDIVIAVGLSPSSHLLNPIGLSQTHSQLDFQNNLLTTAYGQNTPLVVMEGNLMSQL